MGQRRLGAGDNEGSREMKVWVSGCGILVCGPGHKDGALLEAEDRGKTHAHTGCMSEGGGQREERA